MKPLYKIIAGFVVLFILYHSAEYMILFKNSNTGFLLFQLAFFVAAFYIAEWQGGKGFGAWGLGGSPFPVKLFLSGIIGGLLLYGIAWWVNIAGGVEQVAKVPSASKIILQTLPFALGVFLSSCSEDILTRGYIYYHLNQKTGALPVIGISALVYWLNHIYKLGQGPDSWIYIILLGLIFIIPVTITKNLWFTTAMHWAGNTLFFITHQVINTKTLKSVLTPNDVFCICIIFFIPVAIFFLRSKFIRKREGDALLKNR